MQRKEVKRTIQVLVGITKEEVRRMAVIKKVEFCNWMNGDRYEKFISKTLFRMFVDLI